MREMVLVCLGTPAAQEDRWGQTGRRGGGGGGGDVEKLHSRTLKVKETAKEFTGQYSQCREQTEPLT